MQLIRKKMQKTGIHTRIETAISPPRSVTHSPIKPNTPIGNVRMNLLMVKTKAMLTSCQLTKKT